MAPCASTYPTQTSALSRIACCSTAIAWVCACAGRSATGARPHDRRAARDPGGRLAAADLLDDAGQPGRGEQRPDRVDRPAAEPGQPGAGHRGAAHLRPRQHGRPGGVLRHRRVAGLAQRRQQPGRRERRDQHGRREPAQRQGGEPPVGEHLGEQRLVVAAQVGTGRAGAQPAVPARDVVDQIGQRLRHRRPGPAAEQRVQVVGGRTRRRAPAARSPGSPGTRWHRSADSARPRLQLRGQLRLRRAGHHHGQVGLDQDVVDRRGQQRVERGDRGRRRVG